MVSFVQVSMTFSLNSYLFQVSAHNPISHALCLLIKFQLFVQESSLMNLLNYHLLKLHDGQTNLYLTIFMVFLNFSKIKYPHLPHRSYSCCLHEYCYLFNHLLLE